MMRIRIGVVLVLFSSVAISLSWSADDEQSPASKQKATKQKGANRGAAVARLLGPLDKAYAKMDADGDGKVTEEEFGKQLESASNGRVKSQLGSQIFRTYDANGDGNLTLAELLKLESAAPTATPSDTSKPSSELPAAPAPGSAVEIYHGRSPILGRPTFRQRQVHSQLALRCFFIDHLFVASGLPLGRDAVQVGRHIEVGRRALFLAVGLLASGMRHGGKAQRRGGGLNEPATVETTKRVRLAHGSLPFMETLVSSQ